MPQLIEDKSVFTLLEVSQSIKKTLASRYGSSFWIKAEMNKLNHYSHTGHCYPDLVEKLDGRLVAQLRSTLWKREYQIINEKFLERLKEPLKDGIKILFLASITFDPVYGLSLHIQDIDPAYTLGDLESEKQATIAKLKSDGYFYLNKKLPIPAIPKRIAIISVETSKGYADFLEVIEKNPWHYKIFHFLFPAILQGENAISSIMYQLDKIRKVIHHFDLVAIIRGGGGDVGLSCYNSYELTKAIANFPLPVVTGIGHATNETVAELISNFNAITPTKLAEFLLQKFHDFAQPVNSAQLRLVQLSRLILEESRHNLQFEARTFRNATGKTISLNRLEIKNTERTLEKQSYAHLQSQIIHLTNLSHLLKKDSMHIVQNQNATLKYLIQSLPKASANLVMQTNRNLLELENSVRMLSPEAILKRGYSIIWKNGKLVKSVEDVENGDVITAQILDGKIVSKVESKEKKTNE
jgi:exodeoxyribonuclease VII large subunit